MSIQTNSNDNFRIQLDKYFTNWKWFLLSFVVFFSLTLMYLRYATNEYQVSASIKIANNENSENALQEINQVNDYGLFNQSHNSVDDEIEVLKSRSLINNIVSKLNLNVQFFIQGKIKALEIYKNPPVNVSFFVHDSIIRKLDTSFTLNVASKSQFIFEGSEKKLNFGDKIKTSFGDIIITPNYDQQQMKVGKDVTVVISPLEKVSSHYNKNIKIIAAGPNSSIVNITLNEAVAEKGIEILDNLIEEYNNHVIENKNLVVNATSDFINNRLQVVSTELSQVDLTAETIKKDNRLTDLNAQSSIYLQSERDIESQQVVTTTQLQQIDYMDEYLKANNNNGDVITSSMSFEDGSINDIINRHNELVSQRNKILKSSTESNPVIVNLDAQIGSLKQNLNSSLQNSRASNQIRLSALNAEDSRISSKIYSAPKKERQFRDLKRQQDIKESLYLYLLEKREESAISHGVTSPNAIIIDKAYSSAVPVWPKKEVLFIGAFVLGLLLPLIIIYVSSIVDNKVRTKDDIINNLEVPYLGDIPKGRSKQALVKKVDYSPKAEAFRILRTNIDFLLSRKEINGGKLIFVTSTTSQEGKSHTSINLSKSLSFSNKKVLLIETDIRVPKVNKYLKTTIKIGLTDYLISNKLKLKEVITGLDDNLDMITSGTIPPNPAELLMSAKLESLFQEARKNYDYIIVDTSAVGLVTDTLLYSKYADMFVYVVKANYLEKQQLSVAETMYKQNRLPNMAILLNSVKSKKGYGYGYGNSPESKKSWWKFAKS